MDEHMRSFHIGTILTVTTDVFVGPGTFGDVHEFLSYMAGEDVWTHQLPRVGNEAKPVILRQHPQLADADASSVTAENAAAWLAEQVARFGETLPVAPMNLDQHERIDALSELAEKMHPDNIVAISGNT